MYIRCMLAVDSLKRADHERPFDEYVYNDDTNILDFLLASPVPQLGIKIWILPAKINNDRS